MRSLCMLYVPIRSLGYRNDRQLYSPKMKQIF